MALMIRSTRTGKKGERKFRIIVKEKRSRRDGMFIDMLGWYEKGVNGKKQINMEKYQEWIKKGAKPSAAIAALIK